MTWNFQGKYHIIEIPWKKNKNVKTELLSLTNNQINKFQIIKEVEKYLSLFNAEDLGRDTFFHLRTQLIKYGYPKDEVLSIAKELCMQKLQINDEGQYLKFVLDDTYNKCKRKIDLGYDPEPLQEIHNFDYSHINLFSSIYGYEIEYLKSKCLYSEIADIGCGDGIFVKLANGCSLDVEGYEIKKSVSNHNVKIHLIEDFYDINKAYKCLIYNHVLEHIQMRPDFYLRLVINHFIENMPEKELKMIIISLPMHMNIESHLASKHQWVCTDKTVIDDDLKNMLYQYGLKLFYPLIAFAELSAYYNYKLTVNNNIGVYVLEKRKL